MKKLLALALTLAALGFSASPAEAKAGERTVLTKATTGANTVAPQWPDRGGWRGRNRRARVYTQSRLVRYGRAVYRETYQVRVMPNGRTVTRLISRVRVR